MLFALALGLVGCRGRGRLHLVEADPVEFEETVYPILLADCGFPACHGDPRRFFSIYGPGRTRLSSETGTYDPATPDEIALSFTRASSMLAEREEDDDEDDDYRRSLPLLCRSPLAIDAGGASHEGDDAWGAPIYDGVTDPNWLAIYQWALTAERIDP